MNARNAIGKDERRYIFVSSALEDSTISVFVDDTGSGIPDDELESIWDSFHTSKNIGHGSGLGLSINRDIIREHLGEITATNRPDGGARFTLKLPIFASQEPVGVSD